MQHGPSMVMLLIVFLILLGITWLGERILAKWHPMYSGKKVRGGYWLGTVLAVGILFISRWLRPQGGLPGELVRYCMYAAYIWLIGLVFMLVLLLAGYLVRLFVEKFGQQHARQAVVEPAEPEKGQAGIQAAGGLTRREFLQGALAAVPALPFAVSAYGVVGGDKTIVINKYNLAFSRLPAALDGFTIAQISDTHIGTFFGMDKLERVLAMVSQQQPHVLAITGDLVDDLDFLSPTLERLTAFQAEMPFGAFFCWGNHEYFRDITRIRRALYDSPITVLENSHQPIVNGLHFAGVDYPWGKNKAEMVDVRQAYFSQAMANLPRDAFTVLLTHHPDFFDNAFAAGIPLSIAGHTHGGQVVFGGTSLLPVKYKYMKGMFQQNRSYGYVSAGTGHWLPLRIGCPAEVSFFTLKRGLV